MGAFSSKKSGKKSKEIPSDIEKEKARQISELRESYAVDYKDLEEKLKRAKERTNREIEKYKDAKRDLSFICQMVETDNTTMISQITEELITDENYKYLADRLCFGHNINMAYIVYYKKALDDAKSNQGIIADPLLAKIERFKKHVMSPVTDEIKADMKSEEKSGKDEVVEVTESKTELPESKTIDIRFDISDILNCRALFQMDVELCSKMFIWLYVLRNRLKSEMSDLMIHLLEQSYKIDGYEGNGPNINLLKILDNTDIFDMMNIITPSKYYFQPWLSEVKSRNLNNFIDTAKSCKNVSLLDQLFTIIKSESLHDNFIVDPYLNLIRNGVFELREYELAELLRLSITKNYTQFVEECLKVTKYLDPNQVEFSSPFKHTVYELAYFRKNENILKLCSPPPDFENTKWRLGFLDLDGDIDLTIKQTEKDKKVGYSTNSEYSFELIDIVDNTARFAFAVVCSGFVTQCAIMGTICLPPEVTDIKVQTIRISTPRLSFNNWNGNRQFSDSVFLLKTNKDQPEIVHFDDEFHTIRISDNEHVDFMNDGGYRMFAFPWGGGGGMLGAKTLDKPNDLQPIISELREKFECYEVKINPELEGRLWAMNRCGARNHGDTVWMLFNNDFSKVKVGSNIFSDYKYPMICDKIEFQDNQISMDLRVSPDCIISDNKDEIVYHKVINCQ